MAPQDSEHRSPFVEAHFSEPVTAERLTEVMGCGYQFRVMLFGLAYYITCERHDEAGRCMGWVTKP